MLKTEASFHACQEQMSFTVEMCLKMNGLLKHCISLPDALVDIFIQFYASNRKDIKT